MSTPILDNGQGVIDPDVYFQLNKPPASLPEFESKLTAFVEYHQRLDNKIVFITVSHPLLPTCFTHFINVEWWNNCSLGKPDCSLY